MRQACAILALIMLAAAPAAAQRDNDSGFDGPPRDRERGRFNRDAGDERGPDAERRRGGDRGRFRGPANLMFQAIDANGDDVIDKGELRKAIKALLQLDADGDGTISLAEATPERGPGGPRGDGRRGGPGGDPQQFVDRYLEVDANNDGKLTLDEVPERMLPMLRGGDANGDGAIDKEELRAIAEKGGGRFGRGGRGPERGGPDGPGGGRFLERFDRDGDGRLTVQEVPAQMRRMFEGGDQDGDGAINVEELDKLRERWERFRGGRGGPDGDRSRPERPERPEFE